MLSTLIILVLSAVLFVDGRIRSDIVALGSLVALLLTNILTPHEALSGFSNSIVIMMAGLFVVGGAVLQTGLAKLVGSRLLRFAGGSETKLFLLVMAVTSAIGAFLSNTGTVALLLPIVVSMASGAGVNSRRILMPLAFASSIGGMMTLIGTPPNLVIQEVLVENNYAPLSFFSFLPVGVICVTIGTLVLLPLSKYFFSRGSKVNIKKGGSGKTLEELSREYALTSDLFRVSIGSRSSIVGHTIVEMDIQRNFRLNILELRRGDTSGHKFLRGIKQEAASSDTIILSGDILYVKGDYEDVKSFSDLYDLTILNSHASEDLTVRELDFYDIGIAEVILLPDATVAGKKIMDIDFRGRYGVNVLGIRRKSSYILHDLGSEKVGLGDVLLVQGSWKGISRLSKDEAEWVVLGQPLEEAESVTLDHKAPIAALIMLLMVIIMVADFIPVAPVTAVLLAALAMILTGCFRSVETAYKTINGESLVLIAAMLPMSIALEKTGASALLSHWLVSSFGSFGPMMLLAGVYFATSVMTMFISNTATAVLLSPVAMQSAVEMGVSPVPMLFAVAVGASMCFASPFSTPPNALVMRAGGYSFMDYIRVGLPLQVIIGIAMIVALPLLFPFNA